MLRLAVVRDYRDHQNKPIGTNKLLCSIGVFGMYSAPKRLMQRTEWDHVTMPKLAVFLIATGLFFALVLCSEPGFAFIVDHANLLFHEAGHPIVGLFSERLETYGGTIGQLVFPVLLAVGFWRKGQTLSFAGATIWFFENWLNIARYMADARAQVLPLVGGGDHDWHRIFSRWHVLQHDVAIATMVKTVGWIGMIAACVWVFWRAWRDRRHPSPQPGIQHAKEFDLPARL